MASRATRGMLEGPGLDSASKIEYQAVAEPDGLSADSSTLFAWKAQNTRAYLRLTWAFAGAAIQA